MKRTEGRKSRNWIGRNARTPRQRLRSARGRRTGPRDGWRAGERIVARDPDRTNRSSRSDRRGRRVFRRRSA